MLSCHVRRTAFRWHGFLVRRIALRLLGRLRHRSGLWCVPVESMVRPTGRTRARVASLLHDFSRENLTEGAPQQRLWCVPVDLPSSPPTWRVSRTAQVKTPPRLDLSQKCCKTYRSASPSGPSSDCAMDRIVWCVLVEGMVLFCGCIWCVSLEDMVRFGGTKGAP